MRRAYRLRVNPDGFQEIWKLYGGKYTDQTPKLIESVLPKNKHQKRLSPTWGTGVLQ